MSIFELAYVSTASPDLDDAALDDIVKCSQLNNSLRDVSGLLIFNGINFAQIIEGEKKTVLDLFELIKQDNRHSGVRLVSQRLYPSRSFSGWSMAWYRDEQNIFGANSPFMKALALHESSEAVSEDLQTALAEMKRQTLRLLLAK